MSLEASNQENYLSSFLLKCAFPAGTASPTLSPPSSSGSYKKHEFSPFVQQNETKPKLASYQSLANQDPCTIPDELHQEMKRSKKKEEAFKTSLYGFHRRGQKCAYGEKCKFAHSVHELRFPQTKRNHRNYKTVLCNKFSTTGHCKYGIRCQFIHRSMDSTSSNQSNETENVTIDLNVQTDVFRAFALDSTSALPNWHCSVLLH
ncbi:C3H1-type domain-containing protein [Caenorhabditis elegans]|uniref:C3H1-type domain-containing protein n=1 Tax=Caenorhabditis elegans TaxID=6239 RepID=Q9U1Y2_CAEEL|nr:C3H1-type domain-containing protein [Caenorhabditis elegans]CAB60410.1 C3H1-type domain-containing protein [Caenorhabditis elegans]|eukprot:NP_510397.1 Uncharacterized protein CELE_Y60A9.3 [Caenorhabditis elegans]